MCAVRLSVRVAVAAVAVRPPSSPPQSPVLLCQHPSDDIPERSVSGLVTAFCPHFRGRDDRLANAYGCVRSHMEVLRGCAASPLGPFEFRALPMPCFRVDHLNQAERKKDLLEGCIDLGERFHFSTNSPAPCQKSEHVSPIFQGELSDVDFIPDLSECRAKTSKCS